MHYYTAYGLRIHSELPLPELLVAAEADGAADVVIRLGVLEQRPPPEILSGRCYRATAQETLMYWQDGGLCAVRDGRELIVEPVAGVDERVIRLYVIGSALPVLLQQRGLLVLHSSAVVINGQAAAFVGECGTGKSTTAAAMNARGHALLGDDVIAVECSAQDGVRVRPAFPQIKLCPDAAEALCDDPTALPLIHPKEDKRARRNFDTFSRQPQVALRRIYVLENADQWKISRLPKREAFMQLVHYSFVVRLFNSIGGHPQHMDQCTLLVQSVPVCRLARPRDLSALDALGKLVEADMATAEGN